MFTPKQVAKNTIGIGEGKCVHSIINLLVLGLLAGMFISFGAVGFNTASSSIPLPSVARLVGAMVFPCGLAMVLIAGSELFTGNILINIGVFTRKVTIPRMLRNWLWVYIGNFAGALLVAYLCFAGGQFDLFGGALATTTLKTAAAKSSLSFGKAIILGFLCNFLVCIAVWMSFASETVAGKIIALYMPIMVFVLCGFEHVVANMYFGPAGIFAAMNPEYVASALEAGANVASVTWGNFIMNNLIPVTIGNILGGLAVAMPYWFVYLREDRDCAIK